jgi:hypothetical protein
MNENFWGFFKIISEIYFFEINQVINFLSTKKS